MAKDIKLGENHDFSIDPITHDLEITSGLDEIAQRIQATLEIRYGEMERLDPDMGADYTNFLGKHFNKAAAEDDMRAVIEAKVPEVETVDEINFEQLSDRRLKVTFKATANGGLVEGGFNIDNS